MALHHVGLDETFRSRERNQPMNSRSELWHGQFVNLRLQHLRRPIKPPTLGQEVFDICQTRATNDCLVRLAGVSVFDGFRQLVNALVDHRRACLVVGFAHPISTRERIAGRVGGRGR